MVAFALSCLGLLVFLWTSFGGAVPFAPQGYRMSAEFDQAVQLATQSDVRISGVSVGKVISVGLDHHTGLTQFAPRPADTRAILRQKSLLGETYIELTPGSAHGPKLPDGGSLPQGQIAPTVQLDQILSTFDPVTRRAFSTWMINYGIALTNRGQDLNAAFGELYPFATNVDSVLAVLNRESAATTALLHDGGITFSALSQSPAQLEGFVRNSNAAFAATAAQATSLAGTFRAFPAFLVQSQSTVDRLTRFAIQTQPLIDELRPAARELSPALSALNTLAPELLSLNVGIGPLTAAAQPGIPAFERILDLSVPLLTRAKPYLGGIVPVLNYVNTYKHEIAGFFANAAAATNASQATATGQVLHYVRASQPVNPEAVASYQTRLTTNRSNPYLQPGGYTRLINGLPVFGSYLCTNNPVPTISPLIPASMQQTLKTYYFTNDPSGPPCQPQPPLGTLTTGQLQAFPHLQAIP